MALKLAIATVTVLCSVALADTKPNILFILADDLGYNELNFMNRTRGIITPNLDALADAGVILKNYYVQPICSPTRSAMMTGRYTIRLGTQSNVVYWDTPWGVSLNETFIPNNLKDAGYRTAMFGKWHLGMYKDEYTPPRRGFDEHMGYYQGCGSAWTHVSACCHAGSDHNDENYVCKATAYTGYDWWKTGPTPNNGTSMADKTADHTNSAYLIRDAAIDFLIRQKEEFADVPWYMYLPFQNIHGPYTTDVTYYDMYNSSSFSEGEKTMFGYLTEMDFAVGKIMDTLKAQGFMENTVVIFSSDNGAPPASPDVNHQTPDGYIARNYPFRGHKALIFEGGTRVAGFISSPLLPNRVKGTESHELFHVTDWLPTIVGLAGGTTSRNRPLDGHDIWESITTASPSPRTEMLYGINPIDNGGQAGFPKAGLRMGKYKILTWGYHIKGVDGATETGPWNDTNSTSGFANGPCLYDLDADPSETTNLALKMPDQVSKMLIRLEELALSSVQPMTWDPPYQGPDYSCAKCPKHPASKSPNQPWGPWL